MVYKVIGLMSGSSLDGLDIAYVHLQENAVTSKDSPRKWTFDFLHTRCYPYTEEWKQKLAGASELSARDYQLLHVEYGHFLGGQVLRFIEEFGLHYKVQLIASHGHTSFHMPAQKMTAQLGDGAALAATTKINVVSDLRAMDLALGGQGAPIVPIGEKLLLSGYEFFLNLGGIANISRHGTASPGVASSAGLVNSPGLSSSTSVSPSTNISSSTSTSPAKPAGASANAFVAYDVCPANRVLNQLVAAVGREYDEGGALAATGRVDENLLRRLNSLPYYGQVYPKSLANEFGTDIVYPMIKEAGLSTADALRTYVEHIALQIKNAVDSFVAPAEPQAETDVKAAVLETATLMEGLVSGADIAAAIPDPGPTAAPGVQSGSPAAPGVQNGTPTAAGRKMLVTGGGAHHHFLIGRLRELLAPLGVEPVVPSSDTDKDLIDYKEALVVALIGVLRWREENNVLSSVTGASRDSIGGAVWIGQEA